MSACINGYQVRKYTEKLQIFRNFYFVKVEKLSDGQCELDEKRVEMEARFAATLLTRKFKDDQRWQIQEIVSGESTKGYFDMYCILNSSSKISMIE